MRNSNNDVDALVQALRSDLPTPADQARVRARLVAAGGLAAGALTSVKAAAVTGSNAAAGGATVGTAAPLVSQAGFWTQVSALSALTKVGVGTVLAVAVASTSIPKVHETLLGTSAAASGEAPIAKRVLAQSPPQLAVQPQRAQIALGSEPQGSPGASLAEPRVVTGVATSPKLNAVPRKELAPGAAREPSLAPKQLQAPVAQISNASSLAQETPLIERALVALQAGDMDGARYWLNEHARRFPNGLLTQERALAAVRVQSER